MSVVDDYVHNCVGFGRLRALLCWTTMCIIVWVLDDYVDNCVGVGRLCA